MSIVEGLNIFKDSPLLFKPGSNYKYSTYAEQECSQNVKTIISTLIR